MASIILFHSVLGLRPVEKALAAEWRSAGHEVVTPDLFDGRTAETYDDGFAILNDIGLKTVTERAVAVSDQQPDNLVLAGVSMGAGMASCAWGTKPNASGVLFISGPAPWPETVSDTPVQMHAARPEPFDEEEVFDEWRSENPGARLEEFRYDDVGHYFLDPNLPDYSEAASKVCRQRCLEFLAKLKT